MASAATTSSCLSVFDRDLTSSGAGAGAAAAAAPATSSQRVTPSSTQLRRITSLPPAALVSWVEANPDRVAAMLAAPPAATDVSMWWRSLDPTRQSSLLHSAPHLVGSLDGVPVETRNLANRIWMDQSQAALRALVADGGRSVATEAARGIHMLDQVGAALGSPQSVPSRSLLSADPSGQGTAVIALGDLATADYVTYLIPGMFFTVDGQLGDWTDTAARLYDDQVSWLSLVSGADSPPASVAVVAWMGYETPNLVNAGGLDLAYEGRDAIARSIEGLIAERTGNVPHITIVAHSYGSTAALMALTEYDFEIDALAIVGSPGSAARSIAELNVRNGNVFTGEADWDWIPNSSFFGSDPGAASYGAKKMSVGGGMDVIRNELLAASFGHNEYFGAGTESMRNMALIGIGYGQLVTDGSQHDRVRTLASLG